MYWKLLIFLIYNYTMFVQYFILGKHLSLIHILPDVVIYLILGVLFGPVFLNLVNIDSFPVVNEIILTFGSAFILYEGGREIKFKVLNEVKVSVGLLASLGVFITAAIVGLTTYYVFKLPPGPSLLLGATIASTDPVSYTHLDVYKRQGQQLSFL